MALHRKCRIGSWFNLNHSRTIDLDRSGHYSVIPWVWCPVPRSSVRRCNQTSGCIHWLHYNLGNESLRMWDCPTTVSNLWISTACVLWCRLVMASNAPERQYHPSRSVPGQNPFARYQGDHNSQIVIHNSRTVSSANFLPTSVRSLQGISSDSPGFALSKFASTSLSLFY